MNRSISMQVKKVKWYTIELANSHPDHLFIFGDNTIGQGCGGQAAIRYCKNAYGIPTKKYPTMSANAFFYDEDFDLNTILIKEAIDKTPTNYEYIVFPQDGLGTGLAKLPETGPKIYRYLVDSINEKFGKVYD